MDGGAKDGWTGGKNLIVCSLVRADKFGEDG
jgi:hypothetical protein